MLAACCRLLHYDVSFVFAAHISPSYLPLTPFDYDPVVIEFLKCHFPLQGDCHLLQIIQLLFDSLSLKLYCNSTVNEFLKNPFEP